VPSPRGLGLGGIVVVGLAILAWWLLIGRPRPIPPALPTLVLEPASMDLGTLEIGQQGSGVVTLRNASDVELDYRLSLDPPLTDLGVIDACKGVIAPRASCAVTVPFAPGA